MTSIWVQIIQPVNLIVGLAGWACLMGTWFKGGYEPNVKYYNHLGALIVFPIWLIHVLLVTYWDRHNSIVAGITTAVTALLFIFLGGIINYAIFAWQIPRPDYLLPNLSFAGVVLVWVCAAVVLITFVCTARKEGYKAI